MDNENGLVASVCAEAGYVALLNASMSHTQVKYVESDLDLRVPTSSESASTLSAELILKSRGVLARERYNVFAVISDAIFEVVHRVGGAHTLSRDTQAVYAAILGILDGIAACANAVDAEAKEDGTVPDGVAEEVDIICAGGVLAAWSVCAGAGASSQAAICSGALSRLPAPAAVPRVDRERSDAFITNIIEIDSKGDMEQTLVGVVEEFMKSSALPAADRATTLVALNEKGYRLASISDGPISAGITLDSTARDTRGIIARIAMSLLQGKRATRTFALFRGDRGSSVVLFEVDTSTGDSVPSVDVSLTCVVVKAGAASNAAFVEYERDATTSHLESIIQTTDIKYDVTCILEIHRAFAAQAASAAKDVFLCGVITSMLVNAASVTAARALDGDDAVVLPWSRAATDVKRNLSLDCGVVAVAAACAFCQKLSDSAEWTRLALKETFGDSSGLNEEIAFLTGLAEYEKAKFRHLKPVIDLLTPGVLAGTDLVPMGRPDSGHALSMASAIATVRVLGRPVA